MSDPGAKQGLFGFFGHWLPVKAVRGLLDPLTRTPLAELTNEPVPNHMKRWWFALGGTPAYLLVVQILTGILLAFYYSASPESAYESVRYITDEAAFGWYIRGVHKWGATLMIAAVIMHQMRVFFTGAYRSPRELNWMIGMCLLLCTLGIGFTGYSLVFEQLSFWGATVGANITDTVPVVGGFMKNMMLAGDTYNQRTLARFYVLHAAVLPATLMPPRDFSQLLDDVKRNKENSEGDWTRCKCSVRSDRQRSKSREQPAYYSAVA